MTTVAITIPDLLADQAQELGLLQAEAPALILRDAIRREQIGQLFTDADKLAALDLPAMTPDEIQAEIRAARAECRAIRP